MADLKLVEHAPTRGTRMIEDGSYGIAEPQDEQKSVWCIVATTAGDRKNGRRTRVGVYNIGTQVYCFPPLRSGAFESVEVVGTHRKSRKFVHSVVAASDLDDWKATFVDDEAVLPHISPPWDGSHVSQNVAEGIVAWKTAGGAWPVNELRIWNRSRAERVVGEGGLFARLRTNLLRLLGRA
jgi:hypothetical protein